MIEFGKTLREAREAKGLTPAQIAEQTHLLPQIVEDMENEDFHRISAPIYGRGFVKLYCEAVGLEPKPLVDEFMAILNGERTPAIRLREVTLPEAAPDETPAAPEPPPPPVYTQPEFGDPPPAGGCNLPNCTEPDESAFRRNAPTEDARPMAEELNFGEPARPETPPARQYRPDYARAVSAFGPSVNFGRLAILAAGAIALLVLLVWGGRALYRATMTVPGAEPVEETKPADAKPADAKPGDATAPSRSDKKEPSAKPADAKPVRAKRTPKTIPPLYID